MCVFGVLSNLILLYLLTTKLSAGSTHVFYLAFLSVCDMAVEVNYFLMFSVGIIYDYYAHLALFRLWHSYVRPVFTLRSPTLLPASFMGSPTRSVAVRSP